jgi:hypothetical protein
MPLARRNRHARLGKVWLRRDEAKALAFRRKRKVAQRVRDFRAVRDVDFSQHVPVIGDAVARFTAPLDADPAALRAAD